MRVIIQRVKEANVVVNNELINEIGPGFLILVGVTHDDTSEDVDYLVRRVSNLRIFEDDKGKMNISLKDLNYEILSISQFTLYADTTNGNRPSFINAAKPELAEKLYNEFNEKLSQNNITVKTGIFGADMKIGLINDGPVTILIDSKDRINKK